MAALKLRGLRLGVEGRAARSHFPLCRGVAQRAGRVGCSLGGHLPPRRIRHRRAVTVERHRREGEHRQSNDPPCREAVRNHLAKLPLFSRHVKGRVARFIGRPDHSPMHDVHAGGAHGHGHAHETGDRSGQRNRLALTCGLAAVYLVAEVIGGLWTGSLALLADAGHMLSDVAALALALFALWLSDRPAPAGRTFGYRRIEILAALANGMALAVVATFIVFEAVERFGNPTPVLGLPMLVIAAGGLVVNLVGLWILHGGRNDSLNLRGAWLHVLSDALGSAGAMVAGGLIWAFGWHVADPIASIVIAALVLNAAWSLTREAADILLEAAPAHVDVGDLETSLAAVPGVDNVHDLHVWTITSGMVSLSCHVHAMPNASPRELLGSIHRVLREDYAIHHVTIQIEPSGFEEQADVC